MQADAEMGMSRAERMKIMAPQLIADVVLYDTEAGGRKSFALPGWGCPCVPSKSEPIAGFDGFPLLGDSPIGPGDKRRLGFVFIWPEGAVPALRQAGTFYLWEGRFIGEATVIEDGVS